MADARPDLIKHPSRETARIEHQSLISGHRSRLLTVSIRVNKSIGAVVLPRHWEQKTMWNFYNWLWGSGAESSGGRG
ncbi:hypothetical protein GCM10022211_22790 [Sphingomonas humi]|uniref:Uncharacterized protein n=1 Tax=Sphingomonas humi TaxID=335630 RepID=A0ABP7S976_9SPHN